MGNIRTVHLVYFSGTGGTARIANCFERSFVNHGITVSRTELNTKEYAKVEADLLVLLYPVYALNAPKPVDEWVAGASAGNSRPVAIISVSGGGETTPNTACRVGVIKKLEKRGYHICYESMFVMPSNFLIPYDNILSAMILNKAPKKAEKVVTDILSGKELRTSPHLFDRLLSKLASLEKQYIHTFGKKLMATNSCTGCSWCATQCPRNNIIMRNNIPVFGKRCVACLRCVYGCPQKAIKPGTCKFFVLKSGYDLKAIEDNPKLSEEFISPEKIAKGLALKGVRKYLSDE